MPEWEGGRRRRSPADWIPLPAPRHRRKRSVGCLVVVLALAAGAAVVPAAIVTAAVTW